MNPFGSPTIPAQLMQTIYELRAGPPIYQPDHGGQYIPGSVEEIPFVGAILPLSDVDLRRAPQGTFTADSRKLYTNGKNLETGTSIRTGAGTVYTVRSLLDYGDIATLRRYHIERKGTAGNPA